MPTKQLDVFARPEPFFRFNRKKLASLQAEKLMGLVQEYLQHQTEFDKFFTQQKNHHLVSIYLPKPVMHMMLAYHTLGYYSDFGFTLNEHPIFDLPDWAPQNHIYITRFNIFPFLDHRENELPAHLLYIIDDYDVKEDEHAH